VDLDAERAADVFGHDAHLMLGKREVLGRINFCIHVRRLRALIDVRRSSAAFQSATIARGSLVTPGVAAEYEGRFPPPRRIP